MSDELSPEMLEEAAPDLLTLEDEDGKEVTFEVIDATEVNGTRYLAVIPYQEDPESLQEDAELILMRIGTDDEGAAVSGSTPRRTRKVVRVWWRSSISCAMARPAGSKVISPVLSMVM